MGTRSTPTYDNPSGTGCRPLPPVGPRMYRVNLAKNPVRGLVTEEAKTRRTSVREGAFCKASRKRPFIVPSAAETGDASAQAATACHRIVTNGPPNERVEAVRGGGSHGEWAVQPMAPCLLRNTRPTWARPTGCVRSPTSGRPYWGSEPATFTRKGESGRHATAWHPEDTPSTTREHGSLWCSDHRPGAHGCPSHNVRHPNAAEGWRGFRGYARRGADLPRARRDLRGAASGIVRSSDRLLRVPAFLLHE